MTRHEEYMKQAAQQSDSVIKDIVNTTNRISNKLDMVNSPPHYNKLA